MNYTLEIDEQTQTVMVNSTGTLNQDIIKEILIKVASSLKKHQITKVLFDFSAASFNPDELLTEALELIVFMRTISMPRQTKLAFVYPELNEHNQYFEEVAQMDGWKLRAMTGQREALQWLQ